MSSRITALVVAFVLFVCLVGCEPERNYNERFDPYAHSPTTAVLITEPLSIDGCPGFKFARFERGSGGHKAKVLIPASEDVHKGDWVSIVMVVMSEAEKDQPTLEMTHMRVAIKAVAPEQCPP